MVGDQVLHLIVTVHGIRTFGQWQERLEQIVGQGERSERAFYHFKLNYFSLIAFALPPFRWIVVRRFRKALRLLATVRPWTRIDLVGHSFGTHVIAWALRGLRKSDKLNVHTVILSGSVLPQDFDWPSLMGSRVYRVANDCGARDRVLNLSQFFVLFTGMAGQTGFSGMTNERFRNRYSNFGHSGYFQDENGQPSDQYMKDYWSELLTTEKPIKSFDYRGQLGALDGALVWLGNNARPLKFLMYMLPLIMFVGWISYLYIEAKRQLFQAQLNESRSIAVLARQATLRGNNMNAMLASMAVLPSKNRQRPSSAEAEAALHEALVQNHEAGFFKLSNGAVSELSILGRNRFLKGRAGNSVLLWRLPNLVPVPITDAAGHAPAQFATDGGDKLVTYGNDAETTLWDLSNEIPSSKKLSHPGKVIFARLHENKLIARTNDHHVIFWDLSDADNSNPIFLEGAERYAMNPLTSTRTVVAGSNASGVHFWRLDRSNPTDQVLFEGRQHSCAAVDDAGEWIVTCDQTGETLQLWHWTGDSFDRAFELTSYYSSAPPSPRVIFSPNSKYLFLTDGLGGEVFDLESKQWILRPGGYSIGPTWSFTAGSDKLISYSARDARLMTYPLGGYSLKLQREQRPVDYQNVNTYAHADSASVFVFTSKNENILLQSEYGDRKPLVLHGHPARSLAVSQDGQIVAGSFSDGTLRAWSLRDDTWTMIDRGDPMGKSPIDRKDSTEYWIEFRSNELNLGRIGSDDQSSTILSSTAFRAEFIDPATLLVILTDGTIELRQREDGFQHPKVLGKVEITDVNASIDFTRDHRSVAVTEHLESGNSVSLWSLENGVFRRHVLDDVRKARNVEFTQDSSEVAVAFDDNTIRIWNIQHGSPSLVDVFTFSQPPYVGSFGPDKNMMLAIVVDQPILMRRDIPNAQVVFPIPPDKGVRPASDRGPLRFWKGWFSDDGKQIVVADQAVMEDGASYTTPVLSGAELTRVARLRITRCLSKEESGQFGLPFHINKAPPLLPLDCEDQLSPPEPSMFERWKVRILEVWHTLEAAFGKTRD